MADGSLDYPEDVLAELDIVIAAVHDAFRQSPDTMTGRLLDALDHPRVRILAHPTGRLLGSREPIQFDFEKVVEKAAAGKVALEISALRSLSGSPRLGGGGGGCEYVAVEQSGTLAALISKRSVSGPAAATRDRACHRALDGLVCRAFVLPGRACYAAIARSSTRSSATGIS